MRVKVFPFFLLSLLMIIIYALCRNQPKIEEYYPTATSKSPPIIVNIVGGLGNQFFQYAAAYSIAKKRNSDIYICVYGSNSILKSTIASYTSWEHKYSLNQFNITQDKLLFKFPPSDSIWNRYDELRCDIDYYLNGRKVQIYVVNEAKALKGDFPEDKVLMIADYFESDVFFATEKSDILNIYQPTFDTRPIEHLKLLVSSTENSVSVHIRMGDFSRKKDFRLISLSYQREAMQLLKRKLQTKNVTFFVFTDDIVYVKKHLHEGSDELDTIIYMSDHTEDNSLYDLVLMSLCKHNIITNSTFSWWAAYLNKNPDKIVIAPMPKYASQWMKRINSTDKLLLLGELAYPKEWVKIKPKFLNFSNYSGH